MTIAEAIMAVLTEAAEGMTPEEIHNKIVSKGLYDFKAKDPISVVNAQIRRRCAGLDFPSAYPTKLFEISGIRDKKTLYIVANTREKDIDKKEEKQSESTELLPEEKISAAIKEHKLSIQQQVLDCVTSNSPEFFEHLVIDLLLKMGYGYGENAGKVTGRSHDGGIDGVISEDKLGLDLIYIQAKRYTGKKKVGREAIQSFIGAMENVHKGVFITTSSFTNGASSFVKKQQQKSIKLIDGMLLSELLVKYHVGIRVIDTMSIYKIDGDYYGE